MKILASTTKSELTDPSPRPSMAIELRKTGANGLLSPTLSSLGAGEGEAAVTLDESLNSMAMPQPSPLPPPSSASCLRLTSARQVGAARKGRGRAMRTGCALLVAFAGLCLCSPASASALTALDRYVAKPDTNYNYKLVKTIPGRGQTTFVLEMTSQAWLTTNEVKQPLWEHWLMIVKPDK